VTIENVERSRCRSREHDIPFSDGFGDVHNLKPHICGFASLNFPFSLFRNDERKAPTCGCEWMYTPLNLCGSNIFNHLYIYFYFFFILSTSIVWCVWKVAI